MESKFHRWWLGSCVAALLLASWVGGFSLAVTSVFIVIYLTGVTLIGPDVVPAEPVDVVAAAPVDVVAAEPGPLPPAPAVSPAGGHAEASGEPADHDADTPATHGGESGAEVTAVGEDAATADEAPVGDEALPYPDDFEDETAAEAQRLRPA